MLAPGMADEEVLAKLKVISWGEIVKHSTKESLWVVLHGCVFDLTKFADSHPGGRHIIDKQAGKDGTKAFNVIHSFDITETLPEGCLIGKIDPNEPVPASALPPKPKPKPLPRSACGARLS